MRHQFSKLFPEIILVSLCFVLLIGMVKANEENLQFETKFRSVPPKWTTCPGEVEVLPLDKTIRESDGYWTNIIRFTIKPSFSREVVYEILFIKDRPINVREEDSEKIENQLSQVEVRRTMLSDVSFKKCIGFDSFYKNVDKYCEEGNRQDCDKQYRDCKNNGEVCKKRIETCRNDWASCEPDYGILRMAMDSPDLNFDSLEDETRYVVINTARDRILDLENYLIESRKRVIRRFPDMDDTRFDIEISKPQGKPYRVYFYHPQDGTAAEEVLNRMIDELRQFGIWSDLKGL